MLDNPKKAYKYRKYTHLFFAETTVHKFTSVSMPCCWFQTLEPRLDFPFQNEFLRQEPSPTMQEATRSTQRCRFGRALSADRGLFSGWGWAMGGREEWDGNEPGL